MATTRYAPWLQRALRVKDETGRFWTQQPGAGSNGPHEKEGRSPHSRTITKPQTIWEAVEADDAAEIKVALEATPVLAFQRREAGAHGGATLLHEAAFHGSHEAVHLLLQHVETRFPGQSLRLFVDARDTVNSQTTPLIAACSGVKGDVKHRLKIVQRLIHAGADVEQRDAHGDNAVHWCVRTSNNVVLRWLLKATDAAASAVFAENFKRDKPLDIAKRQAQKCPSFLAHSVVVTLRSVDRKCNVRLKMQVIKRQLRSVEHERLAAMETQWATAVASAQDAIDATERLWNEALARAEENRSDAETKYAAREAETARVDAIQWLETKEGGNYLKRQQDIATEQIKLEVLRGVISQKPKDMKKAAAHRVSEAYVKQQTEAARKAAIHRWRMKRPPIPSEPDQLVNLLDRL